MILTLRSIVYGHRRTVFVLFIVCCFCGAARAQVEGLNVVGIHQLVADSKSEFDLQQAARDKQVVTTANETYNKTMLGKLKNKYRELQERYHALGTVIDAANIGIQATPMVNHIVQSQARIYGLAEKNPELLVIAYQTEIEFVSKARSLVNYLIGLCASVGAVNQMKTSDRKMLFDHILLELNTIQSLSAQLASSMYYLSQAGLFRTLNPFQGFIDQDRQIIEDIIRNAEYLKKGR